jgi:excisionase family DNA binding protein
VIIEDNDDDNRDDPFSDLMDTLWYRLLEKYEPEFLIEANERRSGQGERFAPLVCRERVALRAVYSHRRLGPEGLARPRSSSLAVGVVLTLLSVEAQRELTRLIDERIAAKLTESPIEQKGGTSWLTVAEAADYTRVSAAAIYKRIKRGQLPAERPEGSRILIHRAHLEPGTGPERVTVLPS